MPGMMSIGGIASGMKTDEIISKYMEYARRPQLQLQAQKEKSQGKLMAWQDLNTRVLALQTQSESISTSKAFQTKSATSSMEDIVKATASSDATPGTYYVTVNKSAKSHQLATPEGKFTNLDATVSDGTIKITMDLASVDINIDSTNNTLVGVKDAINRASAGVSAAIVNQGTSGNPNYALILTSNQTGEAHAMTVDWGTTGMDTDPVTALPAIRTVQAAQDAEIQLGSLTFKRSTNSITDVIPGVTLNIFNPDETKTVKIDVSRDTASIKSAVQGFVKQYNDIMKQIRELTRYDSQSGESGILLGDYQLQSLQIDLENAVTGTVVGIPAQQGQKTYNALSAIGITTGTDGLLVINDSELSSALANNSNDVAKLFGASLESESPYLSLVSSTSDTKPSGYAGYSIDITQAASRSWIRAGKALDTGQTLTADETLTINGKEITLTAGMSIADVIGEINKHSLTTNVSAFETLYEGHSYLTLRTLQYGSNRDFTAESSASNLGADFTSGLGRVQVKVTEHSGENGLGAGAAGLDVTGTINGERCTGSGQVLTADPESSTSSIKGLQILATGSSTINTTATFIKGVGATLKEMLNKMTSTSGVFTNTQNSLNSDIDSINNDIESMEERLLMQQERMYTQFNRMESQLATLTQQGNYLSAQLTSLNNSKR